MQLLALIKKELLLILHDKHSLLLLFVMPALFILIMSLALQNAFSNDNAPALVDVLYDASPSTGEQQGDETATAIKTALENATVFKLIEIGNQQSATSAGYNRENARQAVQNDDASFLVSVSNPSVDEIDIDLDSGSSVNILISPGSDPLITQTFLSVVRETMIRLRLNENLKALQLLANDSNIDFEAAAHIDEENLFEVAYLYGDSEQTLPSSVQQNVPAWLVFGMFFITIPLSNTFINERKSGTLRRMRTILSSQRMPTLGKLIPYFAINQLQVVLMLAIGITVVPVLGGDQLELGNSLAGLIVISMATSIAALGIALLIASISHSSEQATTLGGAGNIVLAAIGGIMVPTFIMPEAMQTLSTLSPMAWALQGFLDILLRSGSAADVFPEAAALTMLGLITLGLAIARLDSTHD